MATPESGLVQKNPQNATNGRFVHNYSRFPDSLSRNRAYTARFGEYVPSFCFESEPKDNISLNSRDIVDSLSLNAPFKGQIRKIKESFCVHKMALLPLNWDRIYVQPVNGDDVPDDANCIILDWPSKFSTLWESFLTLCKNAPTFTTSSTSADYYKFFTACLRMAIIGEYFYSEGSLLKYCGYSGNAQIHFAWYNDPTYDGFFDDLIRSMFTGILTIGIRWKVGNSTVSRVYRGLSSATPDTEDYEKINSFHDLLSDLRDDPSGVVYSLSFPGTDMVSLQSAVKVVLNRGHNFILPDSTGLDSDLKDMLPTTLNFTRILSYQMSAAHFYSNSGVDFIYTADLFRQYFSSLFAYCYGLNSGGRIVPETAFTWNGMKCPYDYLSGYYLLRLLLTSAAGINVENFTYAQFSYDTSTRVESMCAAYGAIFGFRRSLRFVDYFVGSRTRPLAPFNSDVSVNNNAVSVIDVTKKIQAQRFANAVARTRSKIDNYIKGLFGNAPAPDFHNPLFLTREEEMIFGDEVQNTADAQATQAQSRTALMAANSGRYTFTFHNDDNHPCVYLQIISFDIRRFYTRSVDRQMLQVNRYDMFNPDFQYIGDQPVYGIELGFGSDSNVIPAVFGYQGRDMEFKQSFDIALGGAIRRLNGWFMTDRNLAKMHDSAPVINSDFIRSYPSELDPFYLSLTGFSLGSYFHFVLLTQNHVDASRPMAVDPQILA